ncbi:MAG: hypothetical protein RBT76_05090 [candidate division Zixibacteria bacterium]|jgi:hypothetical protein|nr:hypothetical protein [candidate division Zixibacteria bacterium]
MKKLLILLFCSVLVIAVVASCGQKKTEDGDMSAGGHADEMADTTRMHEGVVDSLIGEGEALLDSAAAAGEQMIDSAAAAGKKMIEGAGH